MENNEQNVETTPSGNEMEEDVFSGLVEDVLGQQEEVETDETEDIPSEVDEVETDEETTEETDVSEEEPFNLDVTYNGEEKVIESKEEAQTLIQKGMNYDKKVTQNQELTGQIQDFKETIQLLGYDFDGFKEAALEQYFTKMADDNGTTKEFEKKQYELNQKEKAIEERAKQSEAEKNTEEAKENQRNQMYDDFIKDHPDVDTIPDEVKTEVKNGVDLNAAYAKYENKQLKQELKQLKKTVENIKKSPTKSTSDNGGEKRETDPFMVGFNS